MFLKMYIFDTLNFHFINLPKTSNNIYIPFWVGTINKSFQFLGPFQDLKNVYMIAKEGTIMKKIKATVQLFGTFGCCDNMDWASQLGL